MPETKYMTTREVAAVFLRNQATVNKWCRDGKIECVHLPNGGYLIPKAAVEAILHPDQGKEAGQ